MELMDEVERQRFLETMRADAEFRAAVRRELLTEELLNLPETVAHLVEVVTQQGNDIAELSATVKTLIDVVSEQRQDLNDLSTAVASLVEVVGQQGQDLATLGTSVSTLVDVIAEQRRDFTELASRVSTYMERTLTLVGEGFAAVRAEIADLRADMRAGFTAVDARFDQVDAGIRDIRDQLAS